VIVRLALLGGDAVLDEELREALAGLPEIALLTAGHSADADMLLAADSSLAAAGDLVRGERSRRSDARILLVAPAGSQSAAQQALDCGAVGIVERPLDAPGLRHALAAAGCFDARAASPTGEDEGHVALLGAGGGMGTTTCAVALAAAHERVFVLDLALTTGDAADVAGVHVSVPDALLRIACGPVATPAELSAGLAHGEACRVLPAPALPEHADLVDERGIARVLDLAVASGLRAIVDCGARVGVETIPVLERASLLAIIASADARGARGARRTALLISRLGLSGRFSGIVATGCRNPSAARALAAEASLPLLATVRTDARVARARERGLAPPGGVFAAFAALAGAPGA
jgi:MinD-like ATPase involved in chromosome partitioning or flagellar assembly